MSFRRWRHIVPLRIRSLLRRASVEAELDEELRGHFERLVEANVRAGHASAEARHAARRAMVDAEATKDSIRDARRVGVIEDSIRDVRYAARVLRKSPMFTVVAALTLALGIGATATMFSVVDAVVLRPLPFDNPDQLVRVYSTRAGVADGGPSILDVRDVAAQSRAFQHLVGYDEWRKNVAVGGSSQPEQMIVGLVPGEFFQALGVTPILGRTFAEREEVFGNNFVAAISRRLWRQGFGGSPDVLGKTIRINDETYTVVAVMPDAIPDWLTVRGLPIDVWTPPYEPPATSSPAMQRRQRGEFTIGRLRDGISLDQARTEVARIGARLAATYVEDRPYGLTVAPLVDSRVGKLRPLLTILAAAVVLVLLIACANLASLLLARNTARRRELLLRTTLGAGRARIARQLLMETLTLSTLGGVGGVLLSAAGCAVVARWHPPAMPQLVDLSADRRVLAFGLVISLLTGLLFGLGPAWSTSRVDVASALRGGGRTGTGTREQQRVRSALVIAETALSVMLISSTALLTQTVVHLRQVELGFDVNPLVKGHVYVPPARYSGTALTRFADTFGDAIRTLPGVRSATVVTGYPPTADRWLQRFSIEGRPPVRAGDDPTTFFTNADDAYLRAYGIPLVRGREFAPTDLPDGPAVAIVNEAFVRRYLGNENGLGLRVHLENPIQPVATSRAITIVGVFRDVVNDGLGAPIQPQVIGLYRQLPEFNSEFKDIVVRAKGDPMTLVPSMQRVLRDMDPDIPLAEVASFGEVVASAVGGLAYATLLLGSFAVLGLVLAAVGMYGVVAYTVAQRTSEIGVRMAIGATPASVLSLVVSRGVTLGAIGAALGIAGSALASRVVGGQLFGVSALDPLTLAGTALTLVAVAATASLIPALRATRIDPVRALRSDG